MISQAEKEFLSERGFLPSTCRGWWKPATNNLVLAPVWVAGTTVGAASLPSRVCVSISWGRTRSLDAGMGTLVS